MIAVSIALRELYLLLSEKADTLTKKAATLQSKKALPNVMLATKLIKRLTHRKEMPEIRELTAAGGEE